MSPWRESYARPIGSIIKAHGINIRGLFFVLDYPTIIHYVVLCLWLIDIAYMNLVYEVLFEDYMKRGDLL